MDDRGLTLDEAAGLPAAVTIAGREYLAKPRTLAEQAEIQAWFRRAIPSPLARAGRAIDQADGLGSPLSQRVSEAMLGLAQRAELSWPPRAGSYAWLDAVDEAGLAWHVVRWTLLPCHPDITEAEARGLVEGALGPGPGESLGELGVLMRVAFEGRKPDPKAPAPRTASRGKGRGGRNATTRRG